MNSSSTSDRPLIYFCSSSDVGPFIVFIFSVVKGIFILPLSIFVLHLGLQKRRQQRPCKPVSHSDVFTYHLAAMELVWGPGLICNICSKYLQSLALTSAAGGLYSFTLYGEAFFHILTCMDRYLAVLHPIVYRRLRNSGGIKIRNINISCVWILSLGLVCLYIDTTGNDVIISLLCFVSFPIIIVTFCSFSVLRVLIRPGPGEGGGKKERVDQFKRRAFHTITAILGVLSFWFLGLLAGVAISQANSIDGYVRCMALCCVCWFSIPTSLVSPLLYLHRSGKLVFLCSSSE